MFRRTMLGTAILFGLAACSDTPMVPEANVNPLGVSSGGGGATKIMVCHLDRIDDPNDPEYDGSPGWELLEVNEKSLDRHIAHGDALPGTEGLDENCQPVAAAKVFARAYSDSDPNDQVGYNAAVDVLIAELVDASGNGSLDVGDEVRTYQYPKSLTPFTSVGFGNFTVTTHTVSNIGIASAARITVYSSGSANEFIFETEAFSGTERYQELEFAIGISYIIDARGGSGSDGVYIDPNSPSEPEGGVNAPGGNNGNDDQFVDVEINLNGL